jgi:hypothetical protein
MSIITNASFNFVIYERRSYSGPDSLPTLPKGSFVMLYTALTSGVTIRL